MKTMRHGLTYTTKVEMMYDAGGNRVKKEVINYAVTSSSAAATCADPAPGSPGLLVTDQVSGVSVEITQTGDLRTCQKISSITSSDVPAGSLTLTDATTGTTFLTFSANGLQTGAPITTNSSSSPASYGDGNFLASYIPVSGTAAVALGLSSGAHVLISGSLPEDVVNSGVAYVDGSHVFTKASATVDYALSYVSIAEGVSKPNNTFEFYLKDHLGSTRAVMVEGGSGASDWLLQEATAYLAYGKQMALHSPNEPSDEAREKFTTKEFDVEGGMNLYDFGARKYDPEIGMWTSCDPLEMDWNVYGYCGGNPIVFFDPNGEYTEVTIWDPVGNKPIPFTGYFAGHSGFGHVSIDINGTTYSFGPKGMGHPTTTAFVNEQIHFRGGVGRVLKLSPDQETRLAKELANNKSAYNAYNNNCVSPVQKGLNDIGVGVGHSLFPQDFGKALDQSNVVQSYNLYIHTPERVENGLEGINTRMNTLTISINTIMIASQAAQAAQNAMMITQAAQVVSASSSGVMALGTVAKQITPWTATDGVKLIDLIDLPK